MVHAVHRNQKAFSLNAIYNEVFERVFLFDEQTLTIVRDGATSENLDGKRKADVLRKVRAQFHKHLRPGPALDRVVARFTNEALRGFEVSTDGRKTDQTLILWKYVRTNVCSATAHAFWGPDHPFRDDPDFYLAALIDFEGDVLSLFALPFPAWTAPKAHAARSRLLGALRDYTERGGSEHAAEFVRNQHDTCREIGTTLVAQGGLGLAFSAIGPLTITAFWMVCYIFADPTLLTRVRQEVDACTTIEDLDRRHPSIDSVKLNSRCSLLFACLAEALRLTSTQMTCRLTQADTQVTDPSTGHTYLFKKGGVVMMVSGGMLDRRDLWGEDLDSFNPDRFLKSDTKSLPDTFDITRPPHLSEAQAMAFAPWGGGAHMCAGRLFAQRCILAYVALLVASCEIEGPAGGSLTPPQMSKKLSVSNAKPASDVEVRISKRTGFEDCEWAFA